MSRKDIKEGNPHRELLLRSHFPILDINLDLLIFQSRFEHDKGFEHRDNIDNCALAGGVLMSGMMCVEYPHKTWHG